MKLIPRASVVIPTLNACNEIEHLLDLINLQTLQPQEIVIIDSASEDDTVSLLKRRSDVRLLEIAREDFNHGITRDMALRSTQGDFICFLTQDAIPASRNYFENLLTPMLADDDIALVSGRQIPKADARPFERLVRTFNYPNKVSVRCKKDLPRFGIKTFFASDVCSAYRRCSYLACGGFQRVDISEDMLMAARFIAAGLKVAYEPSAEILHSHNLTPSQQFGRNKAIGAFLEQHAAELMNACETDEGLKLVKYVSEKLLKNGQINEFLCFGVDCAARWLGNKVGRREARKVLKELNS